MRVKRTAAPPFLIAAVLVVVCGCSSTTGGRDATPAPAPVPTATTTPTPVDPVAEWVEERMSTMTLEQKAAALLMLHAPGLDPAPLRALVDAGASGLILMGDNIPGDPATLAALAAAATADPACPPLIAIDQEGGDVQRLPWDVAASAEALRSQPAASTRDAFAARATAVAGSGATVNFGIVADVTADPASFIFGRVLGTDPAGSAERVAAAVSGERGIVASTLKHFPGHGAAPGDSHTSIPTAPLSLEEWRSGAALPFAAGIDAGAELVMTSHVAYPAVDAAPASLSPEWHRVLRDDLEFDGVVVTDDLLMLQHNGLPEYADPGENAVRAVAAGADLLLYVLPADPSTFGISVPGLVASLTTAVQNGRIPSERIDDAVARVLTLRRSLVAGS